MYSNQRRDLGALNSVGGREERAQRHDHPPPLARGAHALDRPLHRVLPHRRERLHLGALRRQPLKPIRSRVVRQRDLLRANT